MQTIEAYMEAYHGTGAIPGRSTPTACIGDITMSIQASEAHYCEPRDNKGPWVQFEIGFPSRNIPALRMYAEDKNNSTGTVYGWVPANIINQIIADNGGVIKPKGE